MRVTAVIPARYGSSRFPGKPLKAQTGKPLIQHVVEQVRRARRIDQVIVATDDERIASSVRGFGGDACMTRSDHPTGTDRIAEVIRMVGGDANDIIVNVQGDEPEMESSYVDRLVARLADERDCPVATLACPFPADSDSRDPNRVKVVTNRLRRAMYFSRALIPYPRDPDAAVDATGWLLHLGIYAYRQAFLLEYAQWETGALEGVEKLEQLRVLERGVAMAVEVVEHAVAGVDTPADYEAFVRRWRAAQQAARG
ncbi:MAG: 3-deoxy-manno-octulosonate cytidylyltransferase [Phycisphaerae bacterium]